MKLGDVATHVFIDARKLTDYALNLEHPKGRHKAILFGEYLGFTRDNYQSLLHQIEASALEAEVEEGRNDEHGRRYVAYLDVTGPEGRQGIILTVWIVAPETDEARLVTLYPVRRM
ncbi:MAG: hypothetical protein L0177_07115 [Chloroflexi bacterium]|nr:hypothetical protein [Chloroflexota bacterium]